MLTSNCHVPLNFRCRLIEFRTIGPSGFHQNMFEWLLQYFRSRNSDNFLCPVYLQHEGHSQCVVGIDEKERQVLLFDPSFSTKRIQDLIKSRNHHALLNKFSHSVETFNEEQYQMVVVQGIMTNQKEFEVSLSYSLSLSELQPYMKIRSGEFPVVVTEIALFYQVL